MIFLRKLRKNWITVWLVVAALSLTVIISYAAYTRVNVVKRVLSTGAGVGDRFSSDVMSSAVTVTRKGFDDDSVIPCVTGRVFNYPYPKASLYRSNVTDYTLTATIGTYNNNTFTALTGAALETLDASYAIKYRSTGILQSFKANDGTVTFSCSIPAGKVDPNEVYMYFSTDELSTDAENPAPGYCIRLVAEPDDNELPTLTGYVTVRFQEVASTGWTGSLETLESNHYYDGYNYVLEGIGTGRITFRYNPNFVTINDFFLHNSENTFYIYNTNVIGNASITEDSLETNATTGWKYVTLVVNSEEKNRYVIQFYKKDTSGSNDYSNNAISLYLPATEDGDWVEVTPITP